MRTFQTDEHVFPTWTVAPGQRMNSLENMFLRKLKLLKISSRMANCKTEQIYGALKHRVLTNSFIIAAQSNSSWSTLRFLLDKAVWTARASRAGRINTCRHWFL